MRTKLQPETHAVSLTRFRDISNVGWFAKRARSSAASDCRVTAIKVFRCDCGAWRQAASLWRSSLVSLGPKVSVRYSCPPIRWKKLAS